MGNIEAYRSHDVATVTPTTSWPLSLLSLEGNLTNPWSATPTTPRPLTAEERSWISSRLAAVAGEADAPEDPRSALAEVAKMLTGLSMQGIGEAQASARALMYGEAIKGIPTWAIIEARKAWNRADVAILGDHVNLAFPPAPAQLAKLAKAVWFERRGEATRLRRLLNAVEPKPSPPPRPVDTAPLVKAKPIPREDDGRPRNVCTLPPAERALIELARSGVVITPEMIAEAEAASEP